MSILDVHVPDWMEHALCSQVDGEVFFPAKGGSSRAAREICATCPVSTKCLMWAMGVEEDLGAMPGIYGGLSTKERVQLRRKNRRAAA